MTEKIDKRKILTIGLWIAGSFIGLVIAAIIFVLCYFSPRRIAEIATREAAQYLHADLYLGDVNYKIFSTFPIAYIEIDSVRIISRSLSPLSPEEEKNLPAQADLLASTGKINLAINVRKLMKGEIDIPELSVEAPFVNIVDVNDSIANYNIAVTEKMPEKAPELSIGKITLSEPVIIKYSSLPNELEASANIEKLLAEKNSEGIYDLSFGIETKVESPLFSFSQPLKADISGKLDFALSPLKIDLSNLQLQLSPLSLACALRILEKGGSMIAENFNLDLKIKDLLSLKEYIPKELLSQIPELEKLSGEVPLDLTLRLDSPYRFPQSMPKEFSLSVLPAMTLDATVDQANLSYRANPKETINIEDLYLKLESRIDGNSPEDCIIRIPELHLLSDGINLQASLESQGFMSKQPHIEGKVDLRTYLEKSVSPILAAYGLRLAGEIEAKTDFTFLLDETGPTPSLKDVDISGSFASHSLTAAIPSQKVDAAVNDAVVGYSFVTPRMIAGAIPPGSLSLNLGVGNAQFRQGATATNIKKIDLTAKAEFDSEKLPARGSLPAGNVALEFDAGALSLSQGSSSATINNIVVSGNTTLENQTLTKGSIPSGSLNLDLEAATLSLKQKGVSADIKKLEMAIEGAAGKSVKEGPSLNMTLGMSVLKAVNSQLQLMMSGMAANIKGHNLSPGNAAGQPGGDIKIDINNLKVNNGAEYLDLSGIETILSGSLLSMPNSYQANYTPSPAGPDESILQNRVSHTPMYLVPQAPGILAAAMTMADIDAQFKIGAGRFITPSYLAVNLFSDVDISTDLNNLSINSLVASSDDSELSLTGKVSGLGAFLTSGSPSILKADLNVNFNNVDIDRLSGAYYAAVEKQTGRPYDFTMPPQGPYTAADSVCVLIPRNLDANIHLRSKSAEYMGYRFSPLSTDIILSGGDATLRNLSIGAPYCNVNVDWTYATSNMADIGMTLSGSLNDFDFQRFFKVFPNLTISAPEINNLSGSISADFDANFGMFPSMFLNAPSLNAKFNITSNDIEFARTGKIERITHLMMIKGTEPIAVSNLNINGSFHDCLLMLNPFHINFDDYQLGIAGVNNLNGEMYYHIALEKSPFHLPFAVNMVGHFSDPEFRFGGTEIKDGREREISSNLNQKVNVNIMTWLSRGWKMFIEMAAKYDLDKKKDQKEDAKPSTENKENGEKNKKRRKK